MQIKVSTRVLDQRYINDYKLAMKQGKITIADLHILALSELAQCYNDLKSRICCAGYGDGESDIIHRDRVDKWLSDEVQYNSNTYNAFAYLKGNGYIGVCARGYLFNNPRITLTADQNKRLEELLFVVGI